MYTYMMCIYIYICTHIYIYIYTLIYYVFLPALRAHAHGRA